jgi:serine/threonine protein kinase
MTIPTELDSDFHVDVDENLIRWLIDKSWSNCLRIYEAHKESGHIERLWIRATWGQSSLRKLLDEGWRFTGAMWLDVMRGITSGLSELHAHQICHGDLKPSNGSAY